MSDDIANGGVSSDFEGWDPKFGIFTFELLGSSRIFKWNFACICSFFD